jgi:2-aminoadipate transaminase
MPDYSNPSGSSMSLSARNELILLCSAFEVLIVEDQAYQGLGTVSIPSLFQLSGGRGVIQARTLSKVLAPGIRLGWISGSEELIGELSKWRATGANPLLARSMAELLATREFEEHCAQINQAYSRKVAVASNLLAESKKCFKFELPVGGFYLWVRLPLGTDSVIFTKTLANNGILVAAGRYFFAENEEYPAIRISISYESVARIVDGIKNILSHMP